jgi:hypothetical protein
MTSIKYHVTSANFMRRKERECHGMREKYHGDDTPLAQFSRSQIKLPLLLAFKGNLFF